MWTRGCWKEALGKRASWRSATSQESRTKLTGTSVGEQVWGPVRQKKCLSDTGTHTSAGKIGGRGLQRAAGPRMVL